MNDETYEALKGIIGAYKAINWNMSKEGLKGLAMVEGWIDETAKEHCNHEITTEGVNVICGKCSDMPF